MIVSGDLGSHGIAVLSVREGLEFEGELRSDTAAVWPAIEKLIDGGIEIHCLRDLTRGGLSSALNEIAAVAGLHIQMEEGLDSRFRIEKVFTHDEIAQMIGSSRETVTRLFTILRRRNIIETTPDSVVIRDRTALEEMLEFERSN